MRVVIGHMHYTMAQIAPLSFQTSIPHRPSQVRYTLQWSLISHAKGGIRGMRDRLWIFCGDYTFRVFDLHPRGIRDIS